MKVGSGDDERKAMLNVTGERWRRECELEGKGWRLLRFNSMKDG